MTENAKITVHLLTQLNYVIIITFVESSVQIYKRSESIFKPQNKLICVG